MKVLPIYGIDYKKNAFTKFQVLILIMNNFQNGLVWFDLNSK